MFHVGHDESELYFRTSQSQAIPYSRVDAEHDQEPHHMHLPLLFATTLVAA
jgi:hypothetical protein